MAFVESNISFSGLKEIHPDDRQKIKEIIYTKYIFIERELGKINAFKFYCKTHVKGGKKKYSIHLLIDSPKGIFTVDHVAEPSEWDPVAIVHMVINKARDEIKHKLKIT